MVFLFFACEEWYEPETDYSPILITRTELENSISFTDKNVPLQNLGKIYSYGKYLLISERYKGVHIFDNENPASPRKLGFIRILGSVDIAVKDGILYADNAVDLVAIDITNFNNLKVTQRIKYHFPELTPPDNRRVPNAYLPENRPENTIIVAWEKKSLD
ncbi:MAG: hypothetical protein OHK0038_23860 [Flammeovirgaceae bacterium]